MQRSSMVFLLKLFLVILFSLIPMSGAVESQSYDSEIKVFLPIIETSCWPNSLPVGAIPGQPLPVLCKTLIKGPDTSQGGTNSWLDEFDHQLSFASFAGTRYEVFETVGFINKTIHWRHADHWMVDVASHSPTDPPRWVEGGSMLRPARTFRFEDGRFIVEADVAAGIEAYEGGVWPELVISTGDRPDNADGLYGYDMFPEDWTIGCRLQSSRFPVCALKSNDGSHESGGSTRIWEMSAHQDVGTDNYGGSPFQGRENYWGVCGQEDPDMHCRDRFRLELTATSLTLFVNGHKYFEQKNIPALPTEFLSSELYVYFASMVVSHPAEAVRLHWDRLSINPVDTPVPGIRYDLPWLLYPIRH